MVKEKSKEQCKSCGVHLHDEDVIIHDGYKYCPKCMATHIHDQHYSAEIAEVWTYKST